jgi:hypothetical protein
LLPWLLILLIGLPWIILPLLLWLLHRLLLLWLLRRLVGLILLPWITLPLLRLTIGLGLLIRLIRLIGLPWITLPLLLGLPLLIIVGRSVLLGHGGPPSPLTRPCPVRDSFASIHVSRGHRISHTTTG